MKVAPDLHVFLTRIDANLAMWEELKEAKDAHGPGGGKEDGKGGSATKPTTSVRGGLINAQTNKVVI